MATIRPFRALRPRSDLAAQVASVPYDVVNRAEAKALATGNPHSFLHVTRPEIGLSDSLSPTDPAVYQQGATALKHLIQEGWLCQENEPCLYVYALTMEGRTQTGLVSCISAQEYDEGIVRKHEFTRPDKEDDRVRNIDSLGAQSGVVFLVHRQQAEINRTIDSHTQGIPEVDFTAPDGIRHQVWRIHTQEDIAKLVVLFNKQPLLYIADGHHRSAAGARVAKNRRKSGDPAEAESQYMLAVTFPANELHVMGYNRLVRDLNGLTEEEFIQALSSRFTVSTGRPKISKPKQFAMFFRGQWYTLRAQAEAGDNADPIAVLDVTILQEQLIQPILGIDDPRRDNRIDFVGGIRGSEELEKKVNDEGWALAFEMHPTGIEQLLAVADADKIMPPKSTWFEPKLRDGLFVHLIN